MAMGGDQAFPSNKNRDVWKPPRVSSSFTAVQRKPWSFQMHGDLEQFCSAEIQHMAEMPGGTLQYHPGNWLQSPGNPEMNRSLAFLQRKEKRLKELMLRTRNQFRNSYVETGSVSFMTAVVYLPSLGQIRSPVKSKNSFQWLVQHLDQACACHLS